MKATAVLVNWRRPANIPLIVRRLAAQPFVDEILIWDNSAGECKHFAEKSLCGCRVLRSKRNIKLLGRFAAIAAARNEWIVTQDDDCLVHNWPELWREALERPDRITANMHMNEPNGGVIPVRFRGRGSVIGWDIWLGWGSVFRRDLIGRFLRDYGVVWGIDDVLLRDADRVFAVSLGVKHHAVQARTENLPGIDGPMAIHKDGQAGSTRIARQRAAQLAANVRLDRV